MKILFTGASSFTGHWFVWKLAEHGHEVWATFTRESADAYGSDIRGERVGRVLEKSHPVFGCRFGDETFLQLLREREFDLLCHHAADVTNYRSPEFDVDGAVANNTFRAGEVLTVLAARGGSLLLTGSVFEPDEGTGTCGLPAISPYGVSKRRTAEKFESKCQDVGARMGKFVIPNPFGPWEDARFTTYLFQTWSAGQTASVRTPAYIRDNIHVSLLTKAYVDFAERLPQSNTFSKSNPSGYTETQGAFAERFAGEIQTRTGWECRLELATQTEFDEPRLRTNTEPVDASALGWSESAAWDELVAWYRR